MSASVTDTRRRSIRTVYACLALAALCLVFDSVYEYFGYGMFSAHMRMMFVLPLVGAAVSLFLLLTGAHARVRRTAYCLFNAGLATVCIGLGFRGIVNISGRFTHLDTVYYILGSLLAVVAIVMAVLPTGKFKTKTTKAK